MEEPTATWIGVGANLGEPHAHITAGVERLQSLLIDMRCSSRYVTKPLIVEDQPDFINMAVMGYTDLSSIELLTRLHDIEASQGRIRRRDRRFGPRTLDLDILLYGKLMIDTPQLTIPHIGLCERRFVLEPLLELTPELRHPATGIALSEYLARLPDGGIDRIVDLQFDD